MSRVVCVSLTQKKCSLTTHTCIYNHNNNNNTTGDGHGARLCGHAGLPGLNSTPPKRRRKKGAESGGGQSVSHTHGDTPRALFCLFL